MLRHFYKKPQYIIKYTLLSKYTLNSIVTEINPAIPSKSSVYALPVFVLVLRSSLVANLKNIHFDLGCVTPLRHRPGGMGTEISDTETASDS